MRLTHFLVAAGLALAAPPAVAAITTINITGVASGTDNGYIGVASPFGSPTIGINLATQQTFGLVSERPFTLVVRVDDSLGAADPLDPGNTRLGAGAQSPVSAMFTLNGFSYSFGNQNSFIGKSEAPRVLVGEAWEQRLRPLMIGNFTEARGFLYFNIGFFSGPPFKTLDFSEPYNWVRKTGDRSQGELTIQLNDTFGTDPRMVITGPPRAADLTLRFDTLNIAAIPEPSTWALMLVGLGISGITLRRRREPRSA